MPKAPGQYVIKADFCAPALVQGVPTQPIFGRSTCSGRRSVSCKTRGADSAFQVRCERFLVCLRSKGRCEADVIEKPLVVVSPRSSDPTTLVPCAYEASDNAIRSADSLNLSALRVRQIGNRVEPLRDNAVRPGKSGVEPRLSGLQTGCLSVRLISCL